MSNFERLTKTVRRSVHSLVSRVPVTFVVLGMFGLTFVMWAFRNMPETTHTCYKGYYYRVDNQGVMWPEQTKFGVQKCPRGEDDVVSK